MHARNALLFLCLDGRDRVWIGRYSERRKPDLLLLQDLACILGSLIDDKAHLWPGRLEVRRYAVMCQFLRSGRTDGHDNKGTQPNAQLIAETHLFGHLKEVNHLYRGHEEHHVYATVSDAAHSLSQRAQILRQRPLVDRDLDDLSQRSVSSASNSGLDAPYSWTATRMV